ncbi:glycosyl transferase family 1 [Roseivirga ehrenbergii]|uniref:Glycosyl transferase family 1 domain-containing protein n=1 Tax=Roseivirga ehrenbergii (strain DSM 102268 / JCM 13514 / KCTC 12282 / NCIMB 14502 / KMM 6017) TaxID=279360 RepID=A0A150XN40_ROSEK|nr:glycosyltransferase [Roseivirga ehrenbergii]KYG80149.1 hypothetical protein MB14_16540 [Roseivirga ehrenbergii]TCK99178.1 glycosyl transferase family 1 [Roseivirga ehrenbergii]
MSNNLLIITPGFPENENDDTCISALQIYLKGFIEKKWFDKIEVVSIFYPYVAKEYEWNTISVRAFAFPQKNPLHKLQVGKKVFKKIIADKTISKPDIVHSFWLNHCAMIGERLSNAWDIPHLCTLMGQDVHYTKRWQWLPARKDLNLIAVSEFQKGYSKLPIKSTIHWGLESVTLESSAKTYDLIGIGSLTPLKNYSAFVNVVGELARKHSGIKAIIIGNGPEMGHLTKQIDRLGLRQNIELMGHLTRKDTLSLLSHSKILLHPSKFESFGMVIAEALQRGLFVVSKKVGIAGIHEKSRVISSETEMVKEIDYILNGTEDYPSVFNFDISKTINGYIREYISLTESWAKTKHVKS